MELPRELSVVSAAWNAALLANDATAFASFLTDDWVYVGPSGAVPKMDLVEWIASGRLAHHSMTTIGSARVAAYGDTVIVTARRASTGAWEEGAYAADEWITDVFVKHRGRWLCVFSTKCPVALPQ